MFKVSHLKSLLHCVLLLLLCLLRCWLTCRRRSSWGSSSSQTVTCLLMCQGLMEDVLLLSHNLCCSTSSGGFRCLNSSREWHWWAGANRTNCNCGATIRSCHKPTCTKRGHTCCYGGLLFSNEYVEYADMTTLWKRDVPVTDLQRSSSLQLVLHSP